jgi:hypothetical protein
MAKLAAGGQILVLAWLVIFGGVTGELRSQAIKGSIDAKSTISLALNSTEERVKAGSPVRMNVTMKNISDHEIFYWREKTDDPGGFEYKISVWDDKSAEAL